MAVQAKSANGHVKDEGAGRAGGRNLLIIGGSVLLVVGAFFASRYLFGDRQPAQPPEIQQVEQLQRRKNVEGLRASIQSENPSVAVRAIQGLSSVAGDGARPDLERVAKQDRRPEVREAAVLEYARIGSESDVPVLSSVMSPGREPSADVRAAAARSLGEIRSFNSVSALLAGLQDPNVFVRQCAIAAINKITNPVRFNFNPEASDAERAAAIAVIRRDLPRFRSGIEAYVREQQQKGR